MNRRSDSGLSGFARVKAVVLFATVAAGLVYKIGDSILLALQHSPNYVRVNQESSLGHTQHWLVSHYELQ